MSIFTRVNSPNPTVATVATVAVANDSKHIEDSGGVTANPPIGVATVATVAVANGCSSLSERASSAPRRSMEYRDIAASAPSVPSDLIKLTMRYCIEVCGDEPDDVVTMLKDLEASPYDWGFWRNHFMNALQIPDAAACGDCKHSIETGGNLGRCSKSVLSAGASGLWWLTDKHQCIQFSQMEISK